MAYYDHAQGAYNNECKERYEQLKEMLRKSNNTDDEKVRIHLLKLEHESDKMKKELEVYRLFFEQLGKLIPKPHSIHDTIG